MQLGVRGKLEGEIKGKKQENAKWSREVATLEKKMREKEVEMNQTKPLYIKAKEKTSHVAKRLEANKYDEWHSLQHYSSVVIITCTL